jgi:hypothetical protein
MINKNNKMTKAQKADLLIEWDLYSKGQQAPILNEFKLTCKDHCSQEDLLNFLRDKLQIDGYWKKIGII